MFWCEFFQVHSNRLLSDQCLLLQVCGALTCFSARYQQAMQRRVPWFRNHRRHTAMLEHVQITNGPRIMAIQDLKNSARNFCQSTWSAYGIVWLCLRGNSKTANPWYFLPPVVRVCRRFSLKPSFLAIAGYPSRIDYSWKEPIAWKKNRDALMVILKAIPKMWCFIISPIRITMNWGHTIVYPILRENSWLHAHYMYIDITIELTFLLVEPPLYFKLYTHTQAGGCRREVYDITNSLGFVYGLFGGCLGSV